MATKSSVANQLATVITSLAGAWAHAPWWTVLAVIAGSVLLGFVQATFPQESSDRLAWWRAHSRCTNRKHSKIKQRRRGKKLSGDA
jgi:hypothetical protein